MRHNSPVPDLHQSGVPGHPGIGSIPLSFGVFLICQRLTDLPFAPSILHNYRPEASIHFQGNTATPIAPETAGRLSFIPMQIRPMTAPDLLTVGDIDSVIDSSQYLHLVRSGQGVDISWKLEGRPIREKTIITNPIGAELEFQLRQIVSGNEEGLALVAEHDEQPIGLLLAQPDPASGILRILDLRIDFEYRRQGLAQGLLYQAIAFARDRQLRAVNTRTTTQNWPAAQLLLKAGFELAGLDERLLTNHDLVRENVSLIWYASLD
jgi:RimJ/RimL family protein N-acetyltransferase